MPLSAGPGESASQPLRQPGTKISGFFIGNPFLRPNLELGARSWLAANVREVAPGRQKSAICLDFKEGVYIYIYACIYTYIFKFLPL